MTDRKTNLRVPIAITDEISCGEKCPMLQYRVLEQRAECALFGDLTLFTGGIYMRHMRCVEWGGYD